MNINKKLDNYDRNNNIDSLRAICAFFIVCIHYPFPGKCGEYFVALCRIAVPLFLMISGYYYCFEKLNHQIVKIFRLVIYSNILYMGARVIDKGMTITFIDIVKMFFFNESPFAAHLWYLNAFLYVLIIMYIFNKCNKTYILFYLTPFLLLGDLILGKYSLVVWGKELPFLVVRNFIFVGIPYYCIGMMIKNKKNNYHVNKITIVFFIITTILERYCLILGNVNATRDHYISTTFLAIVVFCYSLGEKKSSVILAKIGRYYSTGIYIIHLLIGKIVIKIEHSYFPSEKIVEYFNPILVYTISLLVVMLFNYLRTIILPKINTLISHIGV